MKSEIKKILINESVFPEGLDVEVRLRSFCEIRNGIFSTIQRLNLFYPGSTIYYQNQNELFKKSFLDRNPDCEEYKNEDVDLTITPNGYCSWELLSNISVNIEEDIQLIKDSKKWKNKFKLKVGKFYIIGKDKSVFIHPTATIYPNVVLDVTKGPIIIDKEAKISPFSFLEGPLYIGQNSHIDNARITGGTIIGNTCKIGGEVENSIIGDFSNKHHEGFIGHSHLGRWVNMGALSTTSDLKNNYGIVKISIKNKSYSTETIKFGAIIGDYSKIAIGVMLNTGSVIDIGCNIIDSRFNGYSHPFRWTKSGEKYILDNFLRDSKKIMARRNQNLSNEDENLIISIYEL